MEEEILARQELREDETDHALRPQSFDQFVGQDKLKENLRVFIQAARQRKEPLDHCLFYSPPGLGKTTLATILAREMGVNIRTTAGPIVERVGDLASMLTDLNEGDVFFIDEIHRLSHVVEESLYPVMEDFTFYISTGKGPAASTVKLAIPKFTLVGATTRAGLLTSPLRDRFGIVGHLEYYTLADLDCIVRRSASILKIETEPEGSLEIARRARGTPRIANRLLRRVRDFAQVKGKGVITHDIARQSLDALEVDTEGLDATDRRLLLTMIEKFNGGPVGIDSLAIAISEEIETVSDVYEPFLIQGGFISRTSRGRVASKKAYTHLGLKPPAKTELF